MKVNMNNCIRSYSGTLNGTIFQAFNNGNLCFARNYVVPTLSAHSLAFGSVSSHLYGVYAEISAGYKADLGTYARAYNKLHSRRGKRHAGTAVLFIKLLYAWARLDSEHVDLLNTSVEDISNTDSGAKTVREAVEKGYLPPVPGYRDLTQVIA